MYSTKGYMAASSSLQHPPLIQIVFALQTTPLCMLVTVIIAGWALTAEPVLKRAAEI